MSLEIFNDWRLYIGLMINGFFTGLGVYIANRFGEKDIKNSLKKILKYDRMKRGNNGNRRY